MAVILLVEDDPMTQVLIKSILVENDHTVFVSPSGEHALATLQANNNFDILVTDVMMPGMDGRELISKITTDDNINEMPIILISGAIKSSEVWALLESGAAYFIPKPVKKDVILEYIALCLQDCKHIRAKQKETK